jgi:hypothetical protein
MVDAMTLMMTMLIFQVKQILKVNQKMNSRILTAIPRMN